MTSSVDEELPISAISAPFWAAADAGGFTIQWCAACDQPVHYPREVCPRCHGERLEWRKSAGVGSIYSFTVVHFTMDPSFVDDVPFVIALVDLDEGARLLTRFVTDDVGDVAVGQRVRAKWATLANGRRVPVFERYG